MSAAKSSLNPHLLEILACPKDKGSLIYYEDEQFLYNPRLQMRYEIRHGIPVMLIDQANRLLADAEGFAHHLAFLERREPF